MGGDLSLLPVLPSPPTEAPATMRVVDYVTSAVVIALAVGRCHHPYPCHRLSKLIVVYPHRQMRTVPSSPYWRQGTAAALPPHRLHHKASRHAAAATSVLPPTPLPPPRCRALSPPSPRSLRRAAAAASMLPAAKHHGRRKKNEQAANGAYLDAAARLSAFGWIPGGGAIRGRGGRRLGRVLPVLRCLKSRGGGNWNFGLPRKKKCARDGGS